MKSTLHRLLLGLVVLLCAAPEFTAVAAPKRSGIAGQAWKTFGTPPTPVWTGSGWVTTLQYIPPPQPVATTVAVVSANNYRIVARVQTDADGNFRIPLPPGTYLLVPGPISDPFYKPGRISATVTVKSGEFTSARITYDCTPILFVVLPGVPAPPEHVGPPSGSILIGTPTLTLLPPFTWPLLLVVPPLPSP